MITAQIEVSDTDLIYSKMPMGDFQKEIKRKLVNLLVEELMNKNHIEFTSQIDPTSNTSKYRARIYATPDAQVRMIRKNEK
jgi:DNA-directed RNA polymerase subunit L